MKNSNNVKFKKGSVLLTSTPFIFVLSSKYKSERCDFCFDRGPLLKCSGCSYAHFCGRECQKEGWVLHKAECHNLKRVAPRIVPDAARLLARIIIKLKNGGGHERGFYTKTSFRVFKDLMPHIAEMKKDKLRMEHLTSLTGVIRQFLKNESLPNPMDLLGMYGRMVVNGFNISDNEMQGIGTGIYLGPSVIDHSCAPNTVAVFEGTKIFIRTLIDLPNLDWNKVFISYIDLLNTPADRQRDLQATYYFLCQCSRCVDIEELNLMNSSICQNSDCRKCIPGGTAVESSTCPHCKETVSDETWEEIMEISEFTEQQLMSMKDIAYLDVCRMCLAKQDRLFHPINLQRVKVLDLAMESCIAMNNWPGAMELGTQLVEPFRKYYGDLNPIRAIHLMKLGKIALLLNHDKEAKQWLVESATVLKITHGEYHPVYSELMQLMRQCNS